MQQRKAEACPQGFMCKQNSSDVIFLHPEPRRDMIRFVCYGEERGGWGPRPVRRPATALVCGRASKGSNQVRAMV